MMYADSLPWEQGCIYPTDGLKKEESIGINVGNHESDLIEVSCKHNFWAFPFFMGNEVAKGIGCYFINIRANVVRQFFSYLIFVSRNAGGCQ